MRYVSAQEAVGVIKSGDRVFLHTAGATPTVLINAMTERHAELENVELVAAHTEGEVPYADERYKNNFKINCFAFIKTNHICFV